jgi:murein tripeptide amidase MpaA
MIESIDPQAKRYLVGITARSISDLRELGKYGLDLKKRTAKRKDDSKFTVSGILTDEQIQQVKSLGYVVDVYLDLSIEAGKRLQEVSRINRFVETNELHEIKKQIEVPKYMNAEEVETALIRLNERYPDISELIELKHKTWNGRLSSAIRVRTGSNNNKSDRVGVMFTGGVHAREWGGSDICIHFLINLLSSYKNNTPLIYGSYTFAPEQIKSMLENIDLFVFPDVNPDGKIYSQAHNDPTLPVGKQDTMWWRKNRNSVVVPNGDDNIHHGTGVDINRNFGFLWGSGIGTLSDNGSGKTHSLNYPGVEAFSEPETKNVQDLFDKYENIRYFVDIHSCGEMILYSWGDDDNQSKYPDQNFLNHKYDGKRGLKHDSSYKEYIEKPDETTLIALANSMNKAIKNVRGKQYTIMQSTKLYATSGTSDDYSFSRHIAYKSKGKVYGFTIEFADDKIGFIPPISEMQNIIKEVSSAMTELCISASKNGKGT